jgi:hypothetical protein
MTLLGHGSVFADPPGIVVAINETFEKYSENPERYLSRLKIAVCGIELPTTFALGRSR